MRTFYTILLGSICLFYSCQEAIDFSPFEEKALVILNNPIRFDQLAIGQKSTYISIRHDYTVEDSFCEPRTDTLWVEIINKDTIGYLVEERTNFRNAEPVFYYLKYEIRQVLRDTLINEPSVKEYDELIAIKTKAINEEPRNQYSYLFKKLGAKLYLNTIPQKTLIPLEIENICKVFFLPIMEDDPLPMREVVYHSELGLTKNYIYGDDYYGDLLVSNHDYGYHVDGFNFNYGYSLMYGLVFSGSFRGLYLDGAPQVWHIILD